MRGFIVALSVFVFAPGVFAQTSARGKPDDKASSKTITLTGCVERNGTPTSFKLADEQNGTYQVAGSQIGKYLGQRVEIAGTMESSRLKIRGGLWPSPNVAGQAGAIDPVKAAMASQPGGPATGTGDVNLPTFRVKSVKTLGGGCG